MQAYSRKMMILGLFCGQYIFDILKVSAFPKCMMDGPDRWFLFSNGELFQEVKPHLGPHNFLFLLSLQ